MIPSTMLRVREPFNAFSHLAGAVLSCLALGLLLTLSRGDLWKVASFLIYGASMIILYLASGLYHMIPSSPELREKLRRFDQCAIYLLIAGSYTPVCVLKLWGPWGWVFLSLAWAFAAGGILAQVLWARMPVWSSCLLYAIMGWMSMIAVGPITRSLSSRSICWLLAGGLLYSIGGIVFATERPRLWPRVFGFHELWHVFVLAGSAAHFMMMVSLL